MDRPDLADVDELHAVEAEIIRHLDEEEEGDASTEGCEVVRWDEVGDDAGFAGEHHHAAEDADGHESVAGVVVVNEEGDGCEDRVS